MAMIKHPNGPLREAAAAVRPVLIWDLPLRAFHWLLALTLAACWITQELGGAWMDWHLRLGYLALGLVLFRIVWGVAGTRHSRFSSFLTGPLPVVAYFRRWLAGDLPPLAGHNPLGGWVSVLMLTSVAIQTFSGLFNSDDIFTSGPWRPAVSSAFANSMERLHEFNFYLLLGLIAVHLAAIAAYRIRFGVKLVLPMITGRKTTSEQDGIRSQRIWLGVLIAALVGSLVWGLISAAPEPDPNDLFF